MRFDVFGVVGKDNVPGGMVHVAIAADAEGFVTENPVVFAIPLG